MSRYRIIEINGYHRVMRDGKLNSTHATVGAAMAEVEKLEKRDAEAAANAEKKPKRTMNELLARLWQDATYSPHYQRELWEEFEDRFNDLYARAYAARKGE